MIVLHQWYEFPTESDDSGEFENHYFENDFGDFLRNCET
jgi:hypothetical protein